MRTTTLGTDGPETGVLGLGCLGMSYGYRAGGAGHHIKRARSVHPVTSVQSELSLWTREGMDFASFDDLPGPQGGRY
ncbi:hypothetical protein [Streptomyces sp. GESEQ-35]|uniref:hypothetical protein n=1 Tax=Streptomyces sp. GESEQ-35 TaxID=2812657 RepID=UPI001B31C352|nr:hypothetical protein [Streptomyces sp. GESEQ-35]